MATMGLDIWVSLNSFQKSTFSVGGCWGQAMLLFENWLMKLKCQNHLKPLDTIIKKYIDPSTPQSHLLSLWDTLYIEPTFFRKMYYLWCPPIQTSQQRSYQRWLDKRIYKTERKFWTVLDSQGWREKNLPNAISMQLFGVVFSTFCGKKILKIL